MSRPLRTVGRNGFYPMLICHGKCQLRRFRTEGEMAQPELSTVGPESLAAFGVSAGRKRQRGSIPQPTIRRNDMNDKQIDDLLREIDDEISYYRAYKHFGAFHRSIRRLAEVASARFPVLALIILEQRAEIKRLTADAIKNSEWVSAHADTMVAIEKRAVGYVASVEQILADNADLRAEVASETQWASHYHGQAEGLQADVERLEKENASQQQRLECYEQEKQIYERTMLAKARIIERIEETHHILGTCSGERYFLGHDIIDIINDEL